MGMHWLRLGFLAGLVSANSYAANITFSTFVTAGDINAAETQNATIGFTFAGDKFVGTVYLGTNNRQLYSTDLNGGNVQLFGTALPNSVPSGEIVLAGSLGQGGFAAGTVYAGGGSDVYKYAATGGAPTLFASGLVGDLRGLLFDPGSSFGGNLLAATTAGNIYRIDSSGTPTLLANTGEDTEGMDIIPVGATGWGAYGGYLVTASEGSGAMRLISPTGTIIATGINIPSFETINFIPEDIGLSGNPLEGYYAANYPVNIQKADAAQFKNQNLGGHLLGTSEDGSNARVWDVTYNSGTNSFSVAQYSGNLPNQAEDGIFVTAQRINDVSSPEPGSLLLMGCGLAAVLWARRRTLHA